MKVFSLNKAKGIIFPQANMLQQTVKEDSQPESTADRLSSCEECLVWVSLDPEPCL